VVAEHAKNRSDPGEAIKEPHDVRTFSSITCDEDDVGCLLSYRGDEPTDVVFVQEVKVQVG
jgi:hypothetical protein